MSTLSYLFLFLFILLSSILIFYLVFDQGTTEVTTGNFNSFIGNEIINSQVDYTKYILKAQEKVSNIILEDITIPLDIRMYTLGEGVLAQASMSNPRNVRGGGTIILNTITLSNQERWINIIVHEIFHVLGLGTSEKWNDGVINVNGHNFLDRTLFPRAGLKYDSFINKGLVIGELGDNIPLSDSNDSFPDGGAHLDENIFDIEVMTPIADNDNVVSSLSIAILEDLGFEVSYNFNEDHLL